MSTLELLLVSLARLCIIVAAGICIGRWLRATFSPPKPPKFEHEQAEPGNHE